MNKFDNIFVWGDSHGEWGALYHFINCHDIKNSLFIQVGDLGIGFNSKDFELYRFTRKTKSILAQGNNCLWCIRGNHDKPDYFNKKSLFNTDRTRLIEDYTYEVINDKLFLFVGGAISIDRQWRKDGIDFWNNEKFLLKEDHKNLPTCDVLIVHSAPNICFPTDGVDHLKGFFQGDAPLKEELLREREDLTALFNSVKPKQLYYGHFHKPHLEYVNDCRCRALDINEFEQVRL